MIRPHTKHEKTDFVFSFRRVVIGDGIKDAVFFRETSSSEKQLPYDVPAYDVPMCYEDYSPSLYGRVSWFKDSHAHFPFVPTGNIFTGPIFGRLAFTWKNIPIEKACGGYQLNPDIQLKWNRLEIALVFLYQTIAGLVPIPMAYNPSLPSTYGYTRTHTKEEWARRCAMKSRESFRELFGICRLLMSSRPTWEMLLNDAHKFSPGWIMDFKLSIDGQPLMGAICDIGVSGWRQYMNTFSKDTTLWFLAGYGEVDGNMVWRTKPTDAYLSCPFQAPLEEFLERARQHLHQRAYLLPENAHRGTYSIDGIFDAERGWVFEFHPFLETRMGLDAEVYDDGGTGGMDGAQTMGGNGQLHGESWAAFFARRYAENQAFIVDELPEEKTMREARIQQASQGLAPEATNQAANVYEWVEVDGNWTRQFVCRGYVQNIWNSYSNRQRQYDAVWNEWDLCRELEPRDEGYGVDIGEESLQQYDRFHEDRAPASLLEDELDPRVTGDILHQDLEDIYGDKVMIKSLTPSQTNILRELGVRYGFVALAAASGQTSHQDSRAISRMIGWSLEDWPTEQVNAIGSFFSCLKQLDTTSLPLVGLPAARLWDLHTQNPHHSQQFQRLRSVQGVKFHIRHCNNYEEAEILWQVIPNDNRVLTSHAVPVLECLRKGLGQNRKEVVGHLVNTGQKFVTLSKKPLEHAVVDRYEPNRALGHRPQGYKSNRGDYLQYEKLRGEMLRGRAGRAAIKRGGIVWRLALENLGSMPHAVSLALREPLFFMDTHAIYQTRQEAYYDDELKSWEEDLVCGVYYVYIDGNEDRHANYSWWPRASAWEQSGIWPGYWTSECEKWFQKRLKDINEGKAELRNNKGWKDNLKRERVSLKKLEDANRVLSARFLEGERFD